MWYQGSLIYISIYTSIPSPGLGCSNAYQHNDMRLVWIIEILLFGFLGIEVLRGWLRRDSMFWESLREVLGCNLTIGIQQSAIIMGTSGLETAHYPRLPGLLPKILVLRLLKIWHGAEGTTLELQPSNVGPRRPKLVRKLPQYLIFLFCCMVFRYTSCVPERSSVRVWYGVKAESTSVYEL